MRKFLTEDKAPFIKGSCLAACTSAHISEIIVISIVAIHYARKARLSSKPKT
jgi:hypothetical protein